MQVYNRIREIIREVAGLSEQEIRNESRLEQLHLDSLDMAEVIMDVEEEFDVLVEDENEIHTVNDLVMLVNAQLAAI
ncbi:MAG: acyl carrier protein [Clostridia bacterium]|nr:acyl carrier protein [Clostridia bacterium]